MRRDHAAGTLWMETDENRALANLRSALWRLRRFRIPLVQATATQIGLGEGVWVDFQQGAALAHGLVAGSRTRRVRRLGKHEFELITRDLLPDWYDDWVEGERRCFHLLRLAALDALSEALAAVGHYGAAVEAALAAVEAEPLRESSHRALMKAYAAEGNRAEVVRQYRTYCRILREELGAPPAPDVEEMISAVAAPRSTSQ
jgi:DNA-binding SARP family transcriptional activator